MIYLSINIQRVGLLGNNDITCGQADNTGTHPNQEVNKAEEITYPSINIQGEGLLGKNDITCGQTGSIGMPLK
jgi:hypothetical protein